MKVTLTVAAVVALAAVVPTLGDFGAVRASRGNHLFLAEANGPSPGGRDTAVFAETESNGPTRGGRDSGMVAENESNGASPGSRDTARV